MVNIFLKIVVINNESLSICQHSVNMVTTVLILTLHDVDNMAQLGHHMGQVRAGASCWSLVGGNVILVHPGRQELYLHSDLQNVGRWRTHISVLNFTYLVDLVAQIIETHGVLSLCQISANWSFNELFDAKLWAKRSFKN